MNGIAIGDSLGVSRNVLANFMIVSLPQWNPAT